MNLPGLGPRDRDDETKRSAAASQAGGAVSGSRGRNGETGRNGGNGRNGNGRGGGNGAQVPSVSAVLGNRPFLLLWLSQAATQIGGNMVIYGLTVIIFSATHSTAAVSLLILTFLVPAVVFSAVAGVYVDRIDRRTILIVTNVFRGVAFVTLFLVGNNAALIYLLNVAVSVATTFFAPAEAAMIPVLVPRAHLLQANGIFTLTLNAAFAIGFALFGPLLVTIAGPSALLLLVAVLYLVAAVFCFTLPGAAARTTGELAEEPAPSSPVNPGQVVAEAVMDAEKAVGSTVGQLAEGVAYIREHRSITWSLIYLGITASLIGVLGSLGPAFATDALGLGPKDFVVVVLPLGFGIVTGILLLNSYGRYLPRRRVIEGGLISLGVLLAILSVAGPITLWLQHRVSLTGGPVDVSGLISLLSIVIGIAFMAGVAYAVVAIPSQTQLQEDLPEEVRGRVFGVLNMLVSVASFVPIIIVGPITDVVGTPRVILAVAVFIVASGIGSVVGRGPLQPAEASVSAERRESVAPVDAAAVAFKGTGLLRPAGDPADADAPRPERSADPKQGS